MVIAEQCALFLQRTLGSERSSCATSTVPDRVRALETVDHNATVTEAIVPFGVFRDDFEPEMALSGTGRYSNPSLNSCGPCW